jgi:hypothetical protein
MTSRASLSLLVVSAVVLAAPVSAQSYAQRYWLTPRADDAPAAKHALAEFTAWLSREGDPWRWSVYRVVLGDEVGTWVLRSGGHEWQDFDGTVLPAMEEVSLQLERSNPTLTRRPTGSRSSSVFHITEWTLEPGRMTAFGEVVGAMMESHELGDRPYYAGYYDVIGANAPTVRSSANYPDWVSFGESPRLADRLDEVFEPERVRQLRGAYGDAVVTVRDFVLRSYPEMNGGGND